MASTLPDSLSGAAASTSSPSKARLTLDDITRLFSIPITDAASILGVSTSVLKRLCRKNGIARWPYRQEVLALKPNIKTVSLAKERKKNNCMPIPASTSKSVRIYLLSGKSIDDIKKEAEVEKRKLQKDREEMGKRKADLKANSAASTGSLKNNTPGHALQPGNKFMAPHLDPFNPIKNVPTYLDEFKYGFPSTGLSSVSNKWWGSEESDPQQSSSNVTETLRNPSETLVSLRKRAVEESRNLIQGTKGMERCKLSKKQKLTLLQVFGSSLPDQWKNIVLV